MCREIVTYRRWMNEEWASSLLFSLFTCSYKKSNRFEIYNYICIFYKIENLWRVLINICLGCYLCVTKSTDSDIIYLHFLLTFIEISFKNQYSTNIQNTPKIYSNFVDTNCNCTAIKAFWAEKTKDRFDEQLGMGSQLYKRKEPEYAISSRIYVSRNIHLRFLWLLLFCLQRKG